SVGCYAVLLVPKRAVAEGDWPRGAGAAWESLAPRQFLDRRDASGGDPPLPPVELQCDEISGRSHSRITRMGAPALLGDDEVLRGPVWAEIGVEDERGVLKHSVTAEQIDRGVLVGRSSRCQVGLNTDDTISRVHVLIVRIGQDVWAIDTAST